MMSTSFIVLKRDCFSRMSYFRVFWEEEKHILVNCFKDVMPLRLEMVPSQNVNTPTFSKAALCNSNVQNNPKISADRLLGRICTVRSEKVVV